MPDYDITMTETVTKTYRVTADDYDSAVEAGFQIFDSRDDVDDDRYTLDLDNVGEC
jgi:hypothetical protein